MLKYNEARRLLLSKWGKWILGLIGVGALIFFVALFSGSFPGAVAGGIIFLIGIFLAKLSGLGVG